MQEYGIHIFTETMTYKFKGGGYPKRCNSRLLKIFPHRF